MIRSIPIYLIAFVLLLTAACSPKSTVTPAATDSAFDDKARDKRDIDTLLQQAATTSLQEESHFLQIKAAQLAIAERDLLRADRILQAISEKAPQGENRAEYVYSRALLAFLHGDQDEALALLDSPRLGLPDLLSHLPPTQSARIAELRARIMAARGDYLTAASTRVRIAPLLSGETYTRNHQLIWQNLVQVPASELPSPENTDDDFRAWVELRHIHDNMTSKLEVAVKQLALWQKNWAAHPAARNPPPIIKAIVDSVAQRPQNVAILLPLSGKYASFAKPVLEGITSARYWSSENGEFTPIISIYDTSRNFLSQYEMAVQNKADLIIGPMLKEEMAALNDAYKTLPVKTLALNTLPEGSLLPENLVQFGLAVEDEATQIAQKTRSDDLERSAVLYPQGEWGQRIADAFTQQFEEVGGQVVTTSAYESNNDFNTPVKALLNLDRSHARHWLVQSLAREKAEFEPRRRQDVQYLFLVATPRDARQLKPALNFHYAKSIPVFATSHVYEGVSNADLDKDMNGIYFVDVPWVISGADPLKAEAIPLLPNADGKMQRMFALGVDAYRLTSRIHILESVPDSFLQGATGRLSLKEQTIHRRLDWAYMRQGKALMVPQVARGNMEREP